MSAQSDSRIIPIYKRIVTHINTPIYRNGYFLMISSLSTSGIGLLYWILAAHKYSTYMVGINSAIIAAMTLLAGISELNLMSALIRFIPMAGRSTKRFVLSTYIASLAVSAIISFVFIKNLGFWSPALKFLGENRTLSIWFILSTMSWCIFVLQDSVLTGLRQTSWVPVENTVFSLTKIALMIIFAASIPSFGIYASWTFALIVAILPTNYYIFRKLIPAHEKKEEQAHLYVEPKQVVRFASADYLGALFWIMANTLMPVIVTSVSGATANAYFYLAWTIANTLYLIGPAMGSSLIVETAKDQRKLAYYSHRVFSNTIKMVIPAAIIISISASYILMVFGNGYSTEGATLLRLLALSAIPNVINTVFASTARAQRRMRAVVMTLGSLCSLLLGSSYLLLRSYGIVGIGIGWMASQTLVAIIIYTTQLRKLWININDAQSKSWFTSVTEKTIRRIRSSAYKLADFLHVLPVLTNIHQVWISHSKRNKISTLFPGIISELTRELDETVVNGLKIQQVVHNQTNTVVFFLGSSDGKTPIVVKISTSRKEAKSLKQQQENLTLLTQVHELGEWRQVLPKVIACGEENGSVYSVEYAKPGISLANALRTHQMDWDLVYLAAEGINTLHRATARSVLVNLEILHSWVDEPVKNLIHRSFDHSRPNPFQGTIYNIQDKLRAALEGQQVCVSWIHGDYSPENILIDPSGSKVTGILDWDLAKPTGLPQLDLMHLLISIRMEKTHREFGPVVCSLLQKRDWEQEEANLLQAVGQDVSGNALDLQDLLVLTWLNHINANLSKTSRHDYQERWVQENIRTVLQVFSTN